ncbi:major facilitator superfamily domain-containing protein [Roridomyces roridus]|uniref:Major facilitator superfamily domain-containing protein n=1 Tax=Roridomyces roridus TaxID=1738132 RepID=A0AAD7FRE6_9AGAR|nr:major facilitator superfamily domain-containing protein [Roridomyces roridus]
MSTLDEKAEFYSSEEDVVAVDGTQSGVRRIEAIQSVWGTKSKIALWVSVALASYMYILDNGTNWAWGSYATIQFGHYQQFAAIQCATSILLAIGKPLFAKLTDAAGRAEAIAFALFFYVLGYIINATTPNMVGLGAGSCIWVLGFSGLQIALQIVIADVSTLRWRPIISSLSTGGWYFINFYANGQITAKLTGPGGAGWRWGYGIYAMCYIPALTPIIFVLLWAQRRARAQGALAGVEPEAEAKPPFATRAREFLQEVDAVGLFFLAATLALIFLPIVLAGGSYATTTWKDPAIPAMMVIGGVVTLPAFIYWETKRATHPVIPWRLLRNRTILAGCTINFFDFVSFYLTYGQLYGFVSATTQWKISNLIYYSNCQSLSLTFFGLGWAIIAGKFKTGYKWSLVAALAIRIFGVALMFYARAHQNTAALVMTQIIQGLGGGIAAVASQIGAQGAVPHQDVALATAALLLSAEVGGVVGTAAAGAIWNNRLPVEIAKHLPQLNSTEIAGYVGAPTLVRLLTGEEYTQMLSAYASTMRILLIPGVVIAIIPFAAAFFVKDFRLLEIQNAVEVKTLDGKRAQNAGESIEPEVLDAKV